MSPSWTRTFGWSALYHGLRPWRMSRIVRHAKAAIELPSGALKRAGVGVGDLLTMS